MSGSQQINNNNSQPLARMGSEKASENQQVIVDHQMGDKSLELSLLINIYDKNNKLISP